MITIVTAGDFKYKDIVEVSVARAQQFDYDVIVYDLGDLGFGKKGWGRETSPVKAPIVACLHKPKIIKDCLCGLDEGAMLVYLDADAILNDSIDDVFGDFDMAVTLRRKGWVGGGPCPRFTGYIQAGVLFFVNSQKARDFVDTWDVATIQYGSDQRALNELLDPHTDWQSYNVIVMVEGIRVKILTTDRYNFFYFEQGFSSENKILHFKGGKRKYFEDLILP